MVSGFGGSQIEREELNLNIPTVLQNQTPLPQDSQVQEKNRRENQSENIDLNSKNFLKRIKRDKVQTDAKNETPKSSIPTQNQNQGKQIFYGIRNSEQFYDDDDDDEEEEKEVQQKQDSANTSFFSLIDPNSYKNTFFGKPQTRQETPIPSTSNQSYNDNGSNNSWVTQEEQRTRRTSAIQFGPNGKFMKKGSQNTPQSSQFFNSLPTPPTHPTPPTPPFPPTPALNNKKHGQTPTSEFSGLISKINGEGNGQGQGPQTPIGNSNNKLSQYQQQKQSTLPQPPKEKTTSFFNTFQGVEPLPQQFSFYKKMDPSAIIQPPKPNGNNNN